MSDARSIGLSCICVAMAWIMGCVEFPSAPPLRAVEPPPDGIDRPEIDFGVQDQGPMGGESEDAAPLEPDMAPPCIPEDETCDGTDQDCDGEIDEALGLGAPCELGVGACRAAGEMVCADDGNTRCSTEVGEPSEEECDSVDNDCDGAVDEIFDLDGDGAPRCHFDACDESCPLEADACQALCDAQDCGPLDSGISPLAPDACGDGIDQNCDGVDASCSVAVGRPVNSASQEASQSFTRSCP